MVHFFQSAVQHVVAGVMVVVTAVGGLFHIPHVITIIPKDQVAMVSETVAPLAIDINAAATTTASSTTTVTTTIILSSTTPTSTVKLAVPKPVATTSVPIVKKVAPPPAPPKPVSPPPSLPTTINAQSLLDATTLSLKQKSDGTYTPLLTTSIGNLTWDLGMTTLNGNALIPSYAISYSCNPPPDIPGPSVIDQRPSFTVRTPYRCDISLAALTGNDKSAHSKSFPFTTDHGQVNVYLPSVIDSLLKDDKNTGGFVFNNHDSESFALTGVKFDVSYTGLSLIWVPLILRFVDTVSEKTLAEYHLENIPEDPSKKLTHTQNGIELPLSFSVAGRAEKMLMVQVLGVRKMSAVGFDPTITITLRGVTTDPSDAKVSMSAPQVSWTCIVPIGIYDPTALTGPFATGQACQQ